MRAPEGEKHVKVVLQQYTDALLNHDTFVTIRILILRQDIVDMVRSNAGLGILQILVINSIVRVLGSWQNNPRPIFLGVPPWGQGVRPFMAE